MSRLLSPRAASRLVAFLFAIKVAVLGWNAALYSAGHQYDVYHHIWRARSAGLEVGRMAYNPPLYYLPLLPAVDLHRFYKHGKPILNLPQDDKAGQKASKHLLDYLRIINIAYVIAYYALYIWGIFPRVLGRPGEIARGRKSRQWLLASTFLLTLPGIEKAAVMAHPDVLFMALTALSTYVYLRIEERQSLPFAKVSFWRNLLLAFVTGLTGATRPFAIVSVSAHWLANLQLVVRRHFGRSPDGAPIDARPLGRRLALVGAKAVAISAVVATLAGGWWVFRYVETGEVLDAYPQRYVGVYQPLKKNYDYRHYYTSFYLGALLKEPSRRMAVSDLPNLDPKGNTFFTILYSEIWADHWGYFSGSTREEKVWPKRLLLGLALPLSVYFVYRVLRGLVLTVYDAAVTRKLFSPANLVAGIALLGAGLFVYWQGHAGLLPGKNSTIKFLYVAWMTPYAIAVAFRGNWRTRGFHVALASILLVFMAALPMALHWPNLAAFDPILDTVPDEDGG